ncbi:MAG: class II fructose-bisphosphate aldolase [Patescibacteria group bacterium]
MKRNLREIIRKAENHGVAIGHFNISNLEMLKAIAETAAEFETPVIIGTSEGEREFIDVHEAVALVKGLQEERGQEIFLNADHTHSLEKVKEAVEAGYDAILFDGAKLPFEENVKKTKEVADYVKSVNPEILVEGELGYIGSGSVVREELPEGVSIKPEDLTKPEEAARFVKETGIDLLAPAVGNVHGMLASAPEPALDIKRIKAIREAAGVPLVLHGASGNTDEDLRASIDAGVTIIHISTELRVAWRKGMEAGLKQKPDEIAPYKISESALEEMKKVLEHKLKLFNKIL